MCRVLQATVSNDKGGLTKYICQNYKYIDKNQYQFGFLTYDDTLDFEEEFRKKGALFHRITSPIFFISYVKRLKYIRLKYNYQAVHIHTSYANIIVLLAFKLAGYKKIFIHSHSSKIDNANPMKRVMKAMIHRIGKEVTPFIGSTLLACSKLAGRWMYPSRVQNKVIIANNAIDLESFWFKQQIREQKRKELKIVDETLLLHIGRFTYQKNHTFLIDVFNEYYKMDKSAVLLLVGEGPLRLEIQHKVNTLPCKNNVIFLGVREDIPKLLQAADIFLLPSNFEGLPLVAVEAQATSIPCLLANTITKEAKILDTTEFLPINNINGWLEFISTYKTRSRYDASEKMRQAGYDIHTEIYRIEKVYQNL